MPLQSCRSSDAYLAAKMPESLHGISYLCVQRRPMKNTSTREVGGSTWTYLNLIKQCHISQPLGMCHDCSMGNPVLTGTHLDTYFKFEKSTAICAGSPARWVFVPRDYLSLIGLHDRPRHRCKIYKIQTAKHR